MNKVLLAPLLFVISSLSAHASAPACDTSVRSGVMYMISHKSEIEASHGQFGLFEKGDDDQVNITFFDGLKGEKGFSDTLSYDGEEVRRIDQKLFAYNRKEVELDAIRQQYPELFGEEEAICQNAFFPFTVCCAVDSQ